MKNEEKAALRRQLRSLRPERGTIARESSLICERLLGWPAYRQATCLAAYMAMGHEADVTPLLHYALAQHKKLLLPRIADGEMRFYRVTDLDTLDAGTFGIREPAQDAPEAALEEAQLILDAPGSGGWPGDAAWVRAAAIMTGRCGHERAWHWAWRYAIR